MVFFVWRTLQPFLPKIDNVYHMAEKEFAAVILAAGDSSRMGRPKLSLPSRDGQSFLEHCVGVFLAFGCSRVALVVNTRGFPLASALSSGHPARVIPALNAYPGRGRFFSVQTGLKALQPPGAVFLHNVDSPFVDRYILQMLAAHSETADYVRPVFAGRHGHPVLLSGKVVMDVLAEKGEVENVRDYLSRYSQHFVEAPDDRVLININTPADYRRYLTGH